MLQFVMGEYIRASDSAVQKPQIVVSGMTLISGNVIPIPRMQIDFNRLDNYLGVILKYPSGITLWQAVPSFIGLDRSRLPPPA